MGEKRVEEHKQKSRTCNDASPSVTIEGPWEGKEGKKKGTREGQEEIPPEGLGLGSGQGKLAYHPRVHPWLPCFPQGERGVSLVKSITPWDTLVVL